MFDIHSKVKSIRYEMPPDSLEETDRLRLEIASPVKMSDSVLGVDYSITTLNQNSDAPPLVACLGLGASTTNGLGRADINNLAQRVNQPLIVINPIGTGGSSTARKNPKWTLEDMVSSEQRVLHELSVNELDIMGYSLGGVIAGRLAVAMGAQVNNLVTVSSVGFKPSLGVFLRRMPIEATIGVAKNVAKVPQSVKDEIKHARSIGGTDLLNYRHVRASMRLARMAIPATLTYLPEELSIATRWVDVAATDDKITNYNDHVEATRRRQQLCHPDKTELWSLESQDHMWVVNTPLMMQTVATALKS